MKHSARLALLALCVPLAACTVLPESNIDYKSAGKAPSLEIPPDLTQLARDGRYAAPGGSASASTQPAAAASRATPTAAAQLGDVRIERSGNQRWLVVDRPADKLWTPVREFWLESGFLLTTDESALGIMETDWAENRAKIPQDFIRRSIGRAFDGLYSTGERDRFRTRLERTASGGTEVYVSHRGMVETFSDSTRGTTVWQPRATDPELEAEFLRRLMVKLGATQEQARAATAASAARPAARVGQAAGVPVVQLDEAFDRAWRRVGLSLDRTGFTVEDRDRAAGTYFVRYVEPKADTKEAGFFARLFSGADKPAAPLKYRITVRSQGEATTVSVLKADGTPETSANAQRIVQVLADDLK